MKKIKKFLVAVSATLALGVSAGAIAACGGDDSTLKISFETNGGEKISSIKAEKGDEKTLPQPAEREGFEFAGWYDNKECSGTPVTTIKMGSKNVTYYAKWIELAKITLNLDGGSLEKEVLYLKAGANVADFMKNYTPTKAGLIFGAWFEGEGAAATELAANKKMPSTGLTLTAKYRVEYTVKLMLETVEGGAYEETTVTKSDYVGKTVTVNETAEGYSEIAHDEAKKEGTLSASSAQNVFTQYFARNSYSLTFRPNFPAESSVSADNVTINEKFGVKFTLPSDFSCEGYVLAGWSDSPTGEVKYKTNQIERLVFNQDGETPEAATMEMLGKSGSLYGVWTKGYTDMFGGADTIFFLEEATGSSVDIYLSRGGRFYRGTYFVRQGIFEFDSGSTKISGKLYDGDVFAYSSARRDDMWSFLFDNGELVTTTRIDFDKYNGIKYSIINVHGFLEESEGTYTIDENGYYIAEFTTGDLEGESLTFLVGTVNVDGSAQNAFQVRKDDEIALGEIVGYKVSGKSVMADSSAYTVTLNGFGVATCRKGVSQGTYYYTLKDGVLTVESRYGAILFVGRLAEADGKNVYFAYDETLDGAFEFDNGDTITLNGSHEAVYTVDGNAKEGNFTVVGTSVFGGSIVDVRIGDDVYRMVVRTEEEKVLEEGEIVTKQHYLAETKLANYSEYYYLNNGYVHYAPLIVFDEDKEGEAKVYGINSDTDEYILASKGEYKKLENSSHYVYTASEWFDCEEASTALFDLSKLKVIVFNIDTESTKYSLSYWYSSANGDTNTTEDAIEYNDLYASAKEDGATLELVSGYAFYEAADGMTYQGAFAIEDGIMTMLAGEENYYFAIDQENKKFTVLDYEPYNAYSVNPDGILDQKLYLAFDGMGNATYTVLTLDDDGKETDRLEYKGTVTDTKRLTEQDAPIWAFDSDIMDFNYIEVYQGANKYFIRFNEGFNGEFKSAGETLTLNGYYLDGAKYLDANRNEYKGTYFVEKGGVVKMNIGDNEYRYFDIDSKTKTFTVRGKEYGEYLVTKNQYEMFYVELGGYGEALLYTKMEVEGQDELERNVLTEGEYVIDGKQYILSYVLDGKSVTLIGELGTAFFEDELIQGFLVKNEQTVYTYVNEEDWSMILLDDFGRAVKYDKEGQKEEGKFTVVDDDLIFYKSDDQETSVIYNYDPVKGTIQSVSGLQQVAYYTEALESLIFTEYGFAVFHGTHTYYYRVEDNKEVTIYRQDPSDPNANEYGFVSDNFGAFDENKDWTVEGTEKLYIKTNGFSIEFSRSDGKLTDEGDGQATVYPYPVATNTSIKYPLLNLKFQPSDEAEFTVNGKVDYAGVQTDCTVTREIVDEKTGEAKMYVSLKGYAYRFYIDVFYNGKANTYKIVDMTMERALPSYNFLYSYYVYALFYGQIIENDIGTIYIHGNYDEEGEQEDFHITAEFLEGSEFKGVDDEILAFEKGTYEVNGALYSTTFEATDGEKYSLHFQLASVMGSIGYRVAALTRYQTVTVGNYSLEIGNIVSTEATNFKIGDIYLSDMLLYASGTLLEASHVYELNNVYYYVVPDGGKATYYKIRLTEEGSSLEGDDVPSYEEIEIETETATTLVDVNNEQLSVDISDETGKVLMIKLLNEDFYATDSSYDEENETYTVETTEGTTFYVKLVDGKVEISQ